MVDRFNLDDYVPVNERIMKFREEHPKGAIATDIKYQEKLNAWVVCAKVYRELPTNHEESHYGLIPCAMGSAMEVMGEGYVNATSALENAETSAVGRALAILGYDIKRGIASREEMQKVERGPGAQPTPKPAANSGSLGETVFNFGKKYPGLTLDEISTAKDAKSEFAGLDYLGWFVSNATGHDDLKAKVSEFLMNFEVPDQPKLTVAVTEVVPDNLDQAMINIDDKPF
jgi:hypothetical protein